LQESSIVSVPLEISGLDAVELYAIFCYTETALGTDTGSSLATVIKTKITATTACCKLVTFTNTPLSVYADALRYNKSNPLLYVFTYKLPVTLRSALEVIPYATVDGVKSTAVTSIPPSTSFSKTSPLTGQFILSADSITTTTDCRVFLSFTGDDSSQFASENATVRILPPSNITPAPTLLSAQFLDSGIAVLVTFDFPTDSAGISDITWSCSQVFTLSSSFPGICTWQTTSIVKITLTNTTDTSGNKLSIGDTVTLKEKTVRAFCAGTVTTCALDPYSSGSLIILAPKKAIQPVVVILAPPSIGLCSNLTLDATASFGSAGRTFVSYVWTVKSITNADSSASIIEKYLNSISLSRGIYQPIEIYRELLNPGTYTFALALTNYFNVTRSATVRVDVSDDRSAPSITILGSSYRTVTTSTAFNLPAIATLPTCTTASQALYTWTVKRNGLVTNLQSTGTDPTVFSLPAYSLSINSTYTFEVQVTVQTSTVSASAIVYVTRGEIVAVVTGGYTRNIAFSKDFQLSASSSRDSDVPQNTSSGLDYMVCYAANHVCVMSSTLS
jgi:REJ domain